jgi:GxxExxY protein
MDSNAATGNQRHQGAADAVTSAIIGSAIEVHRELGPGLLESSYEACLAHELATRGFDVKRQLAIPVSYKGISLDCGYRADLLVEDQVIAELRRFAKSFVLIRKTTENTGNTEIQGTSLPEKPIKKPRCSSCSRWFIILSKARNETRLLAIALKR